MDVLVKCVYWCLVGGGCFTIIMATFMFVGHILENLYAYFDRR